MTNWKNGTLNDICTFKNGKGLTRDKIKDHGNYPVMGANGIIGFTDNLLYKNPINIIGRVGSSGEVHRSKTPCWVSDNAIVALPKENSDDLFIYYLLKAINLKQVVIGSTQPLLTQSGLKTITTKILPLYEQKKISLFLNILDEKIELKKKINHNMEQIVNLLFKSFFVDFYPLKIKTLRKNNILSEKIVDFFPDTLVDSELGKIPKGWKVTTIKDLTNKVSMGPFGSDMKISTFVDMGMPIISGKQMSKFLLSDEENKFISFDHAQRLKNSIAQRGDIIITQTGTVGQISLIPENSKYKKYIVSSRQHFCRPSQDNLIEYIFCFLISKRGQHEILKNISTTGVPSISRPVTNLKSIKLLLPNKEILDFFSEIAKPIFLKIRSNINYINNLSSIRDLLTPRLISGKLKIPVEKKN